MSTGGTIMRTLLLIFLLAVLLTGLLPVSVMHGQTRPADFKLSVTTGSVVPWDEKARITIDNTGQAKYVRYTTGNPPAVLAETTFTVSDFDLDQIWQAIQDSSFFSISPSWNDSTARDGMFAKITVTGNGVSHQVSIRNIAQPAVQSIIEALNAVVPANLQLQYTPPDQFDLTPKDPCAPLFGALGSQRSVDAKLRNSQDLKTRAFPGPYYSTISRVPPAELSHAGTVVACNVPIQDAVANGWASLSSKGDFFGDDVSITVKNENHPPCETIEITLYMEFWGPLASEARIDKICQDIAAKWAGATTSSGQKVELGFVTRSNTGATSPPNTAGFHEIQLAPKGSVRSYVSGSAGANSGTDSGEWEVPSPVGTFAHEAGHLMGLPDRYVDYNKQSDGSWVNSKNGQSYANDDAFANYLTTKYPGESADMIKGNLQNTDVWSVPLDGSENDLMADVSKPLTQADIDQLTANPGLLVTVPDGTVIANRDGNEQNLIVMHGDAVYAGPGQTETLNGIYAACIDHYKGIPSKGGVFDVTPPVSQWTGIQAAAYLARLLHYVDSLTLYCGDNFVSQEAIWRLSDNTSSFNNSSVDTLFSRAGITVPNQILDFPRISGSGSKDSVSHSFVPIELYVADIRPAFTSGQVGNPTSFSAHISFPLSVSRPVGLSWLATGPDGASTALTGTDSTASLTPARSGIYEVALKFSVNDSVQGPRTFSSDRKGYVIVPDSYTETFEHTSLTDKYPWQSYGDVPWTISSNNPETGSYAAQPGVITSGQNSTLGIEVSVPADTTINFSVRTSTAGLFDGVLFSIDSLWQDQFPGVSDWKVHKYRLRAGKHRLTWTFTNFSANPISTAWLDNIFFPGNVVVTSAADAKPGVPTVFALEQNYPNPFNPKTGIRYQVPGISNVEIRVYDVVGREVTVLVNERKTAGRYEVIFDGSGLASGVYFYRMTAGNFVQTRKLTLLK
jgi:hypothetical protein